MFIAQHVLTDMPSGTVGFHAGPYLASCDEIYITVAGKGGHAAQPSQYTDQIYIASELVISLKDTVAEKSKRKGCHHPWHWKDNRHGRHKRDTRESRDSLYLQDL